MQSQRLCASKGARAVAIALSVASQATSAQVSHTANGLSTASSTAVTAYVNGRWFDGRTFRSTTFYERGGRLTTSRPSHVDHTADLADGFVVPPFGEAHNHNVESSRIAPVVAAYLKAGIFYVKNPNSAPSYTAPLRGVINVPSSIDAVFANGGLTGSGGHPIQIAQRQITAKRWKLDDGEGGFYFVIDGVSDLNRKWPAIMKGQPDFIKTYLLYSDEYERRRADSTFSDWRGLNPTLLREIVRRAHRAGLRVTTHIENAADFHAAVVAGVDEINHMPGFRPDRNDPRNYEPLSRYSIADADAIRAAQQHTTVVTTLGATIELLNGVDSASPQGAQSRALKSLFVQNLKTLQRHGVAIAIGSDEYQRSTDFETAQLATLSAFSNLDLLTWWCENTAKTIFPERKIGRLREGYEASFLVLDANPLDDLSATHRIRLRIKQGVALTP